jgi:hypothetical protein
MDWAYTVYIAVIPTPTLSAECRPRSIVLSWDADSIAQVVDTSSGNFNIYRSILPSGPFSWLTNVAGTARTLTDRYLTPGLDYSYAITYEHSYGVQPPDLMTTVTFESLPSNFVTNSTCCISTTNLWVDDGPSPMELAQWIMGSGVVVSNATVSGSARGIGIFGNGIANGLPIDSGVILATGPITNAVGPNTENGGLGQNPPFGNNSSALGPQGVDNGDVDLNNMLASGMTVDAIVLEFDFLSSSETLALEYVYASEEYPEFLGAPPNGYNDPMAIILNYTNNIALVPNTNLPVSANTINGGGTNAVDPDIYIPPMNSTYYVDNGDPSRSSPVRA